MNTEKNKKRWVSPELTGEGFEKTNSGSYHTYVEGALPASWPTGYNVWYAPFS